jgi:hypothetical protein
MILAEELISVQFLRNLDEPHINEIARRAWLKEYPEGAVVFHEGQDSAFIYFVLAGKINLEVDEIGPGLYCGPRRIARVVASAGMPRDDRHGPRRNALSTSRPERPAYPGTVRAGPGLRIGVLAPDRPDPVGASPQHTPLPGPRSPSSAGSRRGRRRKRLRVRARSLPTRWTIFPAMRPAFVSTSAVRI